MATEAVLRQRVFDLLYGNAHQSRPAIQKVNGALNSSATALVVDDNTAINAGDVLETTTGEQVYVWSKSGGANVTIERAYNGTTAANIADDSLLKINPIWTIQKVSDAFSAVIQDLNAQGFFTIKGGTAITLVAGQDEYELTETDVHPVKGVLSLYYQEPVTSQIEAVPFRNVWDAGGNVHSAGNHAVKVIDWGRQAAGDDLEVIYAAEIDAVADSDDEPLLEDLFVLGAAGRLFLGSEGPRIHDPGRFTDRTVQPGQPLRDGGSFIGQYQRAAWRYAGYLRTKERRLPGRRWRRAERYGRR